MVYLLTMDWTSVSFLASVCALILTIATAYGAYFGFKNSKDKNASEQVKEIIDNYKELSASLSATNADMQMKNEQMEKQNIIQAAQIKAMDIQMTAEKAAWDAERLRMKADFEIERAMWIGQIADCQAKLKAALNQNG